MSAASDDRARLGTLLEERSFERKKVTLASGKRSDFYVDCKRTILTAEGHVLVGRVLFPLIREHCPEAVAIGGLTLGADPLASAVSFQSFLAGHPLTAVLVRKEAKGHGAMRWVEGRDLLSEGDEVALLEDVVTTGGSSIKAAERLRSEGLRVHRAFALVDRQEGGREALAEAGVALTAVFDVEELAR